MREATEEAFGTYGSSADFIHRLADSLPRPFSIDACRFSTIRLPGFTYRTYLVALATPVPPETFPLNRHECDDCRWFPVAHLPSDVHWGVAWTVSRLGLV